MKPNRDQKKNPNASDCPCGGGAFLHCCAEYLDGSRIAPTAEALMRSRYSAFVLRDEAYLIASWHASTRPAPPLFNEDDALTQWIGLQIKNRHEDGDNAQVEFIARYKRNGRAYKLHENSLFVREDGRWYYLCGEFLANMA